MDYLFNFFCFYGGFINTNTLFVVFLINMVEQVLFIYDGMIPHTVLY